MADLSEVKKVIISLLNVNPHGIAMYKLNKEYRNQEGREIPYSDFSYISLCSFLEEELRNNIQIKVEGLDVMLYPIATKNSAHVIKLVKEQNTTKNKRSAPRKYYAPVPHIREKTACTGSNINAYCSSQAQSTMQQRTLNTQNQQNRSPTMPRLVEYRPFRNSQNNRNKHIQMLVQERLLQSQDAFLAKLTNRSQTPTSSDNTKSPDRRSMLRAKLQHLNEKVQEMQQRSAVKHKNEPQPLPLSMNKHQSNQTPKPVETQYKQCQTSNEDIVWDTSKESIWDDELENAKPPKIDKASAQSYYGVSDSEENPAPSETSEELARKKLADLWLSEGEEDELDDIKDIASEVHKGDTLPVRISDVNNPLKFWVHVRLDKHKKAINKLYKEMEEFYKVNRHSDEYKVTDLDEDGKSYFAANYRDQWHRVEPLDTKMGESVRVSFIDHGTRDIINISEMRKLPKQFWKVPRAALCCALGHIKPIGKSFDGRSADFLVDLVDNEKKMYARILDVNYVKSKATVELILNSNKLIVNDELVRKGHAAHRTIRANA